MEEMTVVSFCVKRSGVAWDRGWVYDVREEKIVCGEYEVKHIRVDLPFWKENHGRRKKAKKAVLIAAVSASAALSFLF